MKTFTNATKLANLEPRVGDIKRVGYYYLVPLQNFRSSKYSQHFLLKIDVTTERVMHIYCLGIGEKP